MNKLSFKTLEKIGNYVPYFIPLMFLRKQELLDYSFLARNKVQLTAVPN
jgi:hypothetical protein